MKLTAVWSRPLDEGIRQVRLGAPSGRRYRWFVDMDGVLVDLAAGVAGNREHRNWKDPDATAEAIVRNGGDPTDPKDVIAFYAGLPKTREADALWQAIHDTSPQSVQLLTSIPPGRYKLAGLDEAKLEWAVANLDPTPNDVLVVPHRGKGGYASPDAVLVDDSTWNTEEWQRRGGVPILHQTGDLRSTLAAVANPDGQLGFEVDDDDTLGGVPTDLPQYRRGGGRDIQFARYEHNNIARRLSLRVAKVPFNDGSNEEVEIWGVYGVKEDVQKELIGLFKKHGTGAAGVDAFLDTAAGVIARYVDKYADDARPELICVPESSSSIATRFAAAVASKTGIQRTYVWAKNRDPAQIQINRHGAAQYAATKSSHAGDSTKRALNPFRRDLAGAARYQWSPEEVMKLWHAKAARWATGEVKTKDLDPFIRRGNMFNLFQPPAEFPQDLDGRAALIVDDVATFNTTITDVARTLYDRGCSIAFGSVLWLL